MRAQLLRAEIDADAATVDRLARFLHGLLEANARLNLTRDVALPGAIVRHIVEPLAAWRVLQPLAPSGPLVDVGPGGGAPGLPIAAAHPGLAVTLVESRERKAAYLRDAAAALDLASVDVRHKRAEQFGRGEGRERFAVAMTRALAAGPIAFEILLPLAQVGGLAAIIAGPGADAWLPAAAVTADQLGGAPPEVHPVGWPGAERDVRLVVVRKTSPSPERFPRDMRRIKKDPARVPAPVDRT